MNYNIKGIKEDFVFYPYSGELNNYKSFRQIAEKGDSVIKTKFADTLKLIKNGTEYFYTFDQLD